MCLRFKRLFERCLVVFFAAFCSLSHSLAFAEYTISLDRDALETGATRGLPRVSKIIDPSGNEIVGYSSNIALVVGVSQYTNGWNVLPGIEEDVVAVRKALEEHGFDVEEVMNPNGSELRETFFNFVFEHGYDPDARLLIYFCGPRSHDDAA